MTSVKIRLDREILYEEIWAVPITVLAVRYNLSDVGLAKLCRRLHIPLPGRGYWAKVRAGHTTTKTPLPALPENVRRFVDITRLSDQEAAKRFIEKQERQSAAPEAVIVQEILTEPHTLVKAALKRLSVKSGWRDERGVRAAPNEVLDISVTPGALDRALRLMDALIKALVRRSVSVFIDSARAQTTLEVDGIRFSLSLSEKITRTDHVITPDEERARARLEKRSRWEPFALGHSTPRYDYHPTGQLIFSVGDWVTRSCRDTNTTTLEARLGEVVNNVFEVAKIVKDRKLQMAQAAEERRRASERYECAVTRLEAEKAALEKLEADAGDYHRAIRILAYVNAVEQDALAAGVLSSELANWIAWARQKADWINPLVHVSDIVLDAPPPKRPGYW